MAGGATQCIKIDTLIFESRVLPDVSSMAPVAGFQLGIFFVHRVGYGMGRMTG